jgi:hypothetical protein
MLAFLEINKNWWNGFLVPIKNISHEEIFEE